MRLSDFMFVFILCLRHNFQSLFGRSASWIHLLSFHTEATTRYFHFLCQHCWTRLMRNILVYQTDRCCCCSSQFNCFIFQCLWRAWHIRQPNRMTLNHNCFILLMELFSARRLQWISELKIFGEYKNHKHKPRKSKRMELQLLSVCCLSVSSIYLSICLSY